MAYTSDDQPWMKYDAKSLLAEFGLRGLDPYVKGICWDIFNLMHPEGKMLYNQKAIGVQAFCAAMGYIGQEEQVAAAIDLIVASGFFSRDENNVLCCPLMMKVRAEFLASRANGRLGPVARALKKKRAGPSASRKDFGDPDAARKIWPGIASAVLGVTSDPRTHEIKALGIDAEGELAISVKPSDRDWFDSANIEGLILEHGEKRGVRSVQVFDNAPEK